MINANDKRNHGLSFGQALDIIQENAGASMYRACWDGEDQNTCVLSGQVDLSGNVISVLVLFIRREPRDIWTPQQCDISAEDWSVSRELRGDESDVWIASHRKDGTDVN